MNNAIFEVTRQGYPFVEKFNLTNCESTKDVGFSVSEYNFVKNKSW